MTVVTHSLPSMIMILTDLRRAHGRFEALCLTQRPTMLLWRPLIQQAPAHDANDKMMLMIS